MYSMILAIYVVVMIVIGVICSKRSKSTEDYILAGRKLPVWMMAFSLVAGYFGSEVAMGASGAAYSMGWIGGAGIPLGWCLCYLVMGLVFTEKMRAMKLYTMSDYLTAKYGEKLSVLCSAVIGLGEIFYVAALIIGFGKVLVTFLGWDYNVSILAGLTVVVVYTLAGGLWSGVITDAIQFIILTISTIVLTFVALQAAGGWSNIVAHMPAAHQSLKPQNAAIAIWALSNMMIPIVSGMITPDGNSRLMAGKSPKASKFASLLSSPLYLFLGILCMLIGFAGLVVYPNISDTELIYPSFAMDYLPPIMSAVVLIGLVSVIMSSSDSALISAATLLAKNVYQPITKEDINSKHFLKVVRAAVVISALIAVVIAVLSVAVENAMYFLSMFASSLWLVIAPLIWGGFFWKKANKTAGVVATIVGAGFLAIWYIVSVFVNPQITATLMMSDIPGEWLGGLLGTIVFIIVANKTYRSDKPVEVSFNLDSD